MSLFEIANIYFQAGLSVIPVHQNKVPIGKWEEQTKTLLPPKESFNKAEGIGLVCGEVSGGVEVIDVDVKYSIDGNLWQDYVEVVTNTGNDVMKKVVIQKTQNGGYHVIYKCKSIEGNQKFASRFATGAEKSVEPNRKTQGLLESRGRGGYIMVAPSTGYEIIQGDILNIPEITTEEREVLIACAKSFHEVPDTIPMPPRSFDGINPFTEYNETADIGDVLQKHGWKYVRDVKGNRMYLRPGSSSVYSAGYDVSRKLLYVFTSSTVFEPNKAFNPSQVLCYLEFNKDFKEMYKWLKDRGYNQSYRNITQDKPKNTYITTALKEIKYLGDVRAGTLEMGKTTGFIKLDEFLRIKPITTNITNGIDNSGKTIVQLFFMVLNAINHGEKSLIWTGENRSGFVFRKLMEFYLCKPMKDMTDDEFKKARIWVDEYFQVIDNAEVFTFQNILQIADEALSQSIFHRLLIDPWNGLNRDKKISANSHEHDEEALRIINHWRKTRKCGVEIICHAVTESYRNRHPKDHPKYANMLMPPQKGDTEGGVKFASKADDFKTIHRYTQHEYDWKWTEIHVRKVKEMETGGRQTFLDQPFKMKMIAGQCGFVDYDGYNPVLKTNDTTTVIKPQGNLNYYEPKDDEPPPF